MSRLANRGVRFWVDEQGNSVFKLPGISAAYTDLESNELHKQFHFFRFRPEIKGSELGSAELENAAVRILNYCTMYNGPVGFAQGELEAIDVWLCNGGATAELINMEMLRLKLIMGSKVLFPTERLLKIFRVPETDKHQ